MEPHAEWLETLQVALELSSAEGAEAMSYIRRKGIRLAVRDQSSGARWRLGRGIDLHPRCLEDPPGAPYALSLVMHEVRHLQQGPLTALSVYGELDAWQAQFNFLRHLAAELPGASEQRRALGRLLMLPMGWDRRVLALARQLMREYAGVRYRVDLLPLYPLPYEIVYRLTGRRPAKDSIVGSGSAL